jgi:hypothetical protein
MTLYLRADGVADPPCSPTAHTRINRVRTLRAVLGRCAQCEDQPRHPPRRCAARTIKYAYHAR